MKNQDRIEEWIRWNKLRIGQLQELVIETRELVTAANQQAKAANQQARDSRFLLERHIEWHEKPLWKQWFGIK